MWVGRREGRRNVTPRRACLGALLGALLVVTLTLPKAATAGDVVCEACICGANPFASACRSADPYSTDECDAVCGAGNGRPYTFPVVCTDFASTRCPTSERGYCVDGVNNDQYQNDLTDCADPACAGDPSCPTQVPALSPVASAIAGALLVAGGLGALARRHRSA